MRELTKGFKRYMLTAENAPLLKRISAGEDVTGQLRHDSPEGGTSTVGFGYKLSDREDKTGLIDGEDIDDMGAEAAMRLFGKSMKDTDAKLNSKISTQNLIPRQYEALMDIEFNVKGGITSFPKYTKAVIDEMWDLAMDESKRSYTDADGVKKPLSGRNRAWAAHFNNQYAATGYGTEQADKEAEMILRPGGQHAVDAAAQQKAQEAQAAPQQPQQQAPQALASNVPTGHLKGMLNPNYDKFS